MSLTMNSNISGMIARSSLNRATDELQTNIERLSSGYRINSASDDPAGLAISEGFKNDVRGLEQASRNANDAISIIQTAEGGMGQAQNILQRMKELAVEANDDTLTASQRGDLDTEYRELSKELDDLADNVDFNNKLLLDGDFSGQFQVGRATSDSISFAISQDFDGSFLGDERIFGTSNVNNISNTTDRICFANTSMADFFVCGQKYTLEDRSGNVVADVLVCAVSGGNNRVTFSGMTGLTEATELEATAAVGPADLNTKSGASFAVDIVEDGLQQISRERSKMGALENRLDIRVESLNQLRENLKAANSRLRDVDVAEETAELTKNQLLTQSASSMVTQANVFPELALGLINGGQ